MAQLGGKVAQFWRRDGSMLAHKTLFEHNSNLPSNHVKRNAANLFFPFTAAETKNSKNKMSTSRCNKLKSSFNICLNLGWGGLIFAQYKNVAFMYIFTYKEQVVK
jgi:hypothetical protein